LAHQAGYRRPVALYAAFGSNLDPEQMRSRCPASPSRGPAWLEGWRLTFGGEDLGWEGSLATVVEDVGSRVFVMLYDVSTYDESTLDEVEFASSGRYLGVMADAAESGGAPDDYVAELRARPCRTVGE
jgi:hypothetical protein